MTGNLRHSAPPPVTVLVEGRSDAAVVEHLLAVRHLDGVAVEVLDGVTNIGRTLARHALTPDTVVAGLCDAGEVRFVERALRQAGLETHGGHDLARHGFFVCDADLEDELIRALGPLAVEATVAELGELGRFRTFQKQPEWRDRATHDQLRRFAGSGSGRKARLAGALALRLTPATTPPPLRRLVDHVAACLSATDDDRLDGEGRSTR